MLKALQYFNGTWRLNKHVIDSSNIVIIVSVLRIVLQEVARTRKTTVSSYSLSYKLCSNSKIEMDSKKIAGATLALLAGGGLIYYSVRNQRRGEHTQGWRHVP